MASSDSEEEVIRRAPSGSRARNKPARALSSSDGFEDESIRPPVSAKARGKRRAREEDSSFDSTMDAEAPVAQKRPAPAAGKRRLSARPPLAQSSSGTNENVPALGHGPAPNARLPPSRVPSGAQGRRVTSSTSAAGGRPSMGGLNTAALLAGPGMGAPPQASASQAPVAPNTAQYEEWMKLATDGRSRKSQKINAGNSWNITLIEYFAEGSLLRNTGGDGGIEGGINFQKASTTLDGCVKIWSLRVDSLSDSTNKLLTGLAGDARNVQMSDDEDEEGEGEPGQEGTEKKTKKRRTKATATLVDDVSKIQHKELDCEFAVDPLYKKVSSEFDEGGAAGILMNNLSCDASLRIVFDGLETIAEPDEATKPADTEDLDMLINVAPLSAECQDQLDDLEASSICPSLAAFKLTADASGIDLNILNRATNLGDSTSSRLTGLADVQQTPKALPPTYGEDQDFYDDGGAGGGEMDVDGDDGPVDFFADAGDRPQGGLYGAMDAPFGRTPFGNRDDDDAEGYDEQDHSMFDRFDAAFQPKNWAGPAHWKMRRVAKAVKDDTPRKGPARERKEKIVLQADFSAPPPSIKELFATSNASTKLAASARADVHVLPDDMHFDSKLLLRFFLKPKASITVRKYGRKTALEAEPNEQLDENFWARRAEERMNTEDIEDSAGPIPFATQFFNDDGPDYDDDAMGDDAQDLLGTQITPLDEDVDLLAQTKGKLKRVRPEHITYAKKAKRVDVRMLKENLWKRMAVKLEKPVEHDDSDAEDAVEEVEEITPHFRDVMTGLSSMYPADKYAEISTSWLFICALHLCNERGLRIKMDRDGDDDDDLLDDDKPSLSVGQLKSLQISREV